MAEEREAFAGSAGAMVSVSTEGGIAMGVKYGRLISEALAGKVGLLNQG